MASDPSFDALMARLRAGDDQAAARVFHHFAHQLIVLARRRLGGRVRQKVDPEDVAQSAFRSFFARQADGQFVLESWDSLWGLLTLITLRKCHRQCERFTAGRRDVRREVPEPGPPAESGVAWEGVAREPSPSDAALLTELVESLMSALEGRERQILELRLQGCTIPEISAAVGRTERTVHRVLERVRRRLERMAAEDAGET